MALLEPGPGDRRDVGPTSEYVLSHPAAGDQIAAGLEELRHDHVVDGGAPCIRHQGLT